MFSSMLAGTPRLDASPGFEPGFHKLERLKTELIDSSAAGPVSALEVAAFSSWEAWAAVRRSAATSWTADQGSRE